MSSALSSALANLDGSLKLLHAELTCLSAGLDVDAGKVNQSLLNVRYRAAMLRQLIHAERPDAVWANRNALERLMDELGIAAAAKKRLGRAARLLDMAAELEAGTVKHRFDARAAALDAVRVEAITELRRLAESDAVDELPGPAADEWLQWAWQLEESDDGQLIDDLRRRFTALERFVCEVEPNYWVASRRQQAAPESRQLQVNQSAAEVPMSLINAAETGPEPSLHNIREEFEKASQTGDYEQALSLCYGMPVGDAPVAQPEATELKPLPAAEVGADAALIHAMASGPQTKVCDSCGGAFSDAFRLCPFDNSPLRTLVPAEAGATIADNKVAAQDGETPLTVQWSLEGRELPLALPSTAKRIREPENAKDAASSESAKAEVERLKWVMAERNGGDPSALGTFSTVTSSRKLLISGAAAAAVLLAVGLWMGYQFGPSPSTLRSSVVEASEKVAGVDQEIVPDAVIQKDLEEKFALLQGSSIQATVSDGVVTLAGRSPSKWEQLHAEAVALYASGVRQVKSEIQVEEPSSIASKTPAAKSRAKKQN